MYSTARDSDVGCVKSKIKKMKIGIYKHSKKGTEYKVHFVAKYFETLEDMVVYEALYENGLSKYWVSPMSTSKEIVEVKGEKVPRFVWVRDK